VGDRVELVIDPLRKESVTITLPLTFRVPVEAVAHDLGLPAFVDLSDPIVAKAAALAGAARRWDPRMRFAVFGGTAHRLRCPVSNDPTTGLRHGLHDLDIALTLKDVRPFQGFLREVAAKEGSGLTFFETSGDRIYNALSGGQRLRWHMVVEQQGSEVALGTLDIIADTFQFCHRIDVRADVENAATRGWTLAPVHLLLGKGQFIQRIPEEDSVGVRERVLEPFGRHDVLIGPESKDVRDILALLHDHAIGEGAAEISARELTRSLEGDWGLWKTFGLNLEMVRRSSVLRSLADALRHPIEERLTEVEQLVRGLAPKRRFGFLGGAWWQEVDSTPSVDSTVRVK
jgi:hypothetical protein